VGKIACRDIATTHKRSCDFAHASAMAPAPIVVREARVGKIAFAQLCMW
jgi:hypothetical protein